MPKNTQSLDFNQGLAQNNEVGFVDIICHPVVSISGLPFAKPQEMLIFESGDLGIVLSLTEKYVQALLLSRDPVITGMKVARSDKFLAVPVSQDLLGSCIDPLGTAIYDANDTNSSTKESRTLDIHAPGFSLRERVTTPFHTGVTVVDLMIPLGKGQRELILGDRKTGKTEFIMQVILNQVGEGNICIYAAIGKKRADLKKVENFIREKGIANRVIIVSSSITDPLGMIYLTPYAAMSIAEYFKDQGNDVALILDDLTTHAKFYREIALIGGKFPGRSSYPGDIFYTHARLLERAGNFKTKGGINSITCLPLAETVGGDISGYIQTNLMSITDGHIFFDKSLFEQGRRPAINYFLSVTRVGRQTQSKLYSGITRELGSFLALLEKSQNFAHFGTELNEGLKATISMGDKILAFFDQPMGVVISKEVQIVMFCLIWVGSMNNLTREELRVVLSKTVKLYQESADYRSKVTDIINSSKDFNDFLGRVSSKLTWFMDSVK